MVTLAHNWWTLVIRGLLAICIGVVAFARPALTLFALVFAFAVYAFVSGVMALVAAVRGARRGERWGPLVFEGVVGIGAALVALIWPQINLIVLLALVAAWAIATGAFELIAAVRLRKVITGEWLLALSGIATIAFGLLLVLYPPAGVLALAFVVGVYALLFGITLCMLGFRLRSWLRQGGAGMLPA